MHQPLRSFVLTRALVTLPLLAALGCTSDSKGDGSGSPDGGDAASGGSGTGAGGRASGGAAPGGGGTASGGTASGGTASGGTASGGTASGGTSSGGAGPGDSGVGGAGPTRDGGTDAAGDAPTVTPTAFRMTELVLLDPQPQVEGSESCNNVRGLINDLIATNFNGDAVAGDSGAGDGELDLSFVMVHRPLQQSGSGDATFYQAACTAPTAGTTCTPKPSLPGLAYTVTNQSTGTCLAADAANVTSGAGPIVPATAGAAGCMASSSATFPLALGPVNLTFDSARIGAQWVGDPATGMIEGIFIGFLSQARVNQIVLPPELGSFPLASAFPTGSAAVNCTDEIDVGPDGTTPGWWWHLNFRAEAVGWTD